MECSIREDVGRKKRLKKKPSRFEPVFSGVSLEALKAERRHELAFEGLRYFDLVRWGDCKAAFEALGTVKVSNGLFADDGSYPDDYAVTQWSEDKKFLAINTKEIWEE